MAEAVASRAAGPQRQAPAKAGGPKPEGYELSEGAFLTLRDLPEVCGIARPGEELGGVKAPDHHYLIRFWPLLVEGSDYQWELGPSLLFDIDTTAPPDAYREMKKNGIHCTKVVRLRMGKGGDYGAHDLCAHGYDGNDSVSPHRGGVCAGTAVFSAEPFAAALMLRAWLVQSAENWGQCTRHNASLGWWKGEAGKKWLEEYPLPNCIVPPSVYGAALDHAVVIPLRMEWVERVKKGDRGKPFPYLPQKEVREIARR